MQRDHGGEIARSAPENRQRSLQPRLSPSAVIGKEREAKTHSGITTEEADAGSKPASAS